VAEKLELNKPLGSKDEKNKVSVIILLLTAYNNYKGEFYIE
jgi:hypothetical protein